ncbi:hypothetical protein [Streptomyces sp. NPDC048442]|uniref:hypothetical protein n=1 Tax=Streptomyces sp. NPDC048442 TaxID=3154823 RepID=UPI00344A95DC
MKDKTETACRICGLDDGEVLFDTHGVPQYVICECCYNESGIGDDNVAQVREMREHWIAQGTPWFDAERKPDDWDPVKQLTNIPTRWR